MSSDPSTTGSDRSTDTTTGTTGGTTTGTSGTTTDTTGTTADTASDRSLMDKFGSGSLAAILIIAGIALFLFPEPATSMAGIALIVLGVASWALGKFM